MPNPQKKFRDYWDFSRKYDQYIRASSLVHGMLDPEDELSEKAQHALRKLDKQRAAYQETIGGLNLQSLGCQTCKGRCCDKQPERYFTAIDYWLAKYGERQTHPFDAPIPFRLRYYLLSPLRYVVDKFSPERATGKKQASEEKCALLGEEGCMLPYSDRPMKCVVYACEPMRAAIDDATRAAYTEAIQGLRDIALKTFQILKDEAHSPAHYGRVRLTVLP